jgi:hypothetical protein
VLHKILSGHTALPAALLHDETTEGRLHSWPIVKPVIATKLFVASSTQRPQTIATKVVIKTIKDVFAQYRRTSQ